MFCRAGITAQAKRISSSSLGLTKEGWRRGQRCGGGDGKGVAWQGGKTGHIDSLNGTSATPCTSKPRVVMIEMHSTELRSHHHSGLCSNDGKEYLL